MIVIYRGFGCLVPVILAFFAIVGALGGTTGLAVALVMAAGVLWFLGRAINGGDHGNEHTLYFVPVQYWSLVGVAAAVLSVAYGSVATVPVRSARFERANLELLSSTTRTSGASELSERIARDLDFWITQRLTYRSIAHIHVYVSDFEAVALVRYRDFDEEGQPDLLAEDLWYEFRDAVEAYACRVERGATRPLVVTIALRGALSFRALATGARTQETPFVEYDRISRDDVSMHFDSDVAWGVRSERCEGPPAEDVEAENGEEDEAP